MAVRNLAVTSSGQKCAALQNTLVLAKPVADVDAEPANAMPTIDVLNHPTMPQVCPDRLPTPLEGIRARPTVVCMRRRRGWVESVNMTCLVNTSHALATGLLRT
jgi:hypothetical protein